jgi:hypothetical protein
MTTLAWVWAVAALAFVGGMWVGSALGRRQAADQAALLTGDLAMRAALHGDDRLAGQLFAAVEGIRSLGDGR